MAHLDPVSGQWVADDNGPVPLVPDAGSLGAQNSPALPPVLPQPPPEPPRNLIKSEEPITITAGPNDAIPAAGTPDGGPPLPPPGSMPAQAATPVTPSPGVPDLPPAPMPVLPGVGTPPGARPQLVTSQKLTGPEQVDALKNVDTTNAAIRQNTAAAGDIGVQKATNASAQADQLLQIQQAQAAKQDAIRAAFEKQQAIDNANIAKARADGLKDPDAGESWTHRLLRALAIGLGQYSAAMTHTENMAATIFANDRKEKKQAQVDKLNAAKEAGKLTAEQFTEQKAALDAKDVGQIEAFKARWQAESAKLGIHQARIDANANTLALDNQAAEARAKLLNEDRVTVRDETPKEIAEGKGKGKGGGGGGLDKESQLAAYLEKNPGDMKGAYAFAGRLGMNRKAADDVFAREKEQSVGARTEADKFASENGVNAISKQQRELGELSKALKDNAGNPLQQALAVEKAVSAARGGAASKQALALALGHLGGSLDEADGFIQKIKDGQLGPKQLQNFEAFIGGQRGAAQAAGKDAYDKYQQMIEDAPDAGTKARLLRERSRLFSGMDGYGGKGEPAAGPAAEKARAAKAVLGGGSSASDAHPSVAPIGTVKQLPNGTTVKKVGPNNWQPVQ